MATDEIILTMFRLRIGFGMAPLVDASQIQFYKITVPRFIIPMDMTVSKISANVVCLWQGHDSVTSMRYYQRLPSHGFREKYNKREVGRMDMKSKVGKNKKRTYERVD